MLSLYRKKPADLSEYPAELTDFFMKILIVEDQKLARLTLRGLLVGHELDEAATLKDGYNKILSNQYDIAFLDLDLDEKLAGLKLAKLCKEQGLYAVITTGHEEDELVKKAYQIGCQDYLTKPISQNKLDLVFSRFISIDSEQRIDNLIRKKYITNHQETLSELNLIKRINLSDKPVLIKGPSGTGKTIVANLIREACRIPEERFVSINCAQFSENLLESELFGHKKGSFTGATHDKIGLLEKANNGFIFFDEIHSLSRGAQQKLMKAIEEKIFYPVGSSVPVTSNFRVICATCENLLDLIEEKKFRSDFYARISHLQIQLYGLKVRKDDIFPLIRYYSEKFERKISISEEAKKILLSLEWMNNTRDIESLVDYWNINGIGFIKPEHIPSNLLHAKTKTEGVKLSRSDIKKIKEMGLKNYLDFVRDEIVKHFLDTNEGNKTYTAKELQISDRYIRHSLNGKSEIKMDVFKEQVHENTIQ